MAERKALVVINGQVQETPIGDSIYGGGSLNLFTQTVDFVFGSEEDYAETDVTNAVITNANFKGFNYIAIGTTETSQDDWKLNDVTLQLLLITDNTSVKIGAYSDNNATGTYRALINIIY